MLCLARGLAEHADDPMEAVAYHYYRWVQSDPFDIGNTTRSALGAAKKLSVELGVCADMMTSAAVKHCMASKANGSLMRCVPMAVWGRRLPQTDLVSWARRDSQLSHPNAACSDAVAAYVLAIAHLLTYPGDHAGAVARAEAWAKDQSSEVSAWLALSRSNCPAPFHPQAGYIKIAFTHAFMHLGRGSTYEQAVRETLAGGGDTDTNACIVGGLIGGLHGVEGIPQAWRAAVLGCDTDRGRPRPAWLHPRQLAGLVTALMK